MYRINKHILEAINRGINLALDDFEDDINLPSSKQNIIKNIDTKELWKIHSLFVDLGLPSGTLWGKYNLGVDPKNLKKYKNWFGKYYEWGNDKVTRSCISTTNKHIKIIDQEPYYTKYFNHINTRCSAKGVEDNLSELCPKDDAATALLGQNCKTPSIADIEELLKYTTHEWKKYYNGVLFLDGIVFTSKINGEEIFFPAAGIKHNKTIDSIENIFLWTNSLATDTPDRAYTIYIAHDDNNVSRNRTIRQCGCPIRPVYKP